MKRFFLMISMALMASFFALQAAEVTFDFSTAEGITAMGYAVPAQSAGTNLVESGAVSVGGVTLSAADGATQTRIWNSQGSFSLRIYVDGSITLSVAEGSITGVTVNAANPSNFDLIADVGDYTANGMVGSWSGSASSVTLTHVGSKNAQVASVVVTTAGEGPVDPDPEDPIDPDITKLDSLNHLAALEDGTAFQFTTDVYVNYQWNDHLWVMQLDDEGYALAGVIYGDTGKQYPLGAVIPAGWTGVKNTYKGLVEIQNPAHFANAKNILDEDYYSAIDCTGYLYYVSDPDLGWENYKVSFSGVQLSDIDNRGNFTISSMEVTEDGVPVESSMAGFNKLGIEYPEVDPTELYGIEGMVTIYNDIMELYPITITNDPGTRLWKVIYEGEDGEWYKVNDTLYVAAVSDAADGKLVYVTDNVSEIYYDTYADWGYAEWMDWYPDWIALDCSDDEALFESLAHQCVLLPGTVKGILDGRGQNPRLILNATPVEAADAEYPELTVFSYDLDKDYLGAIGNELGRIDGYFFYKDGEPYLCSEQDSVTVKLCFDYAPALEESMAVDEGFHYGLLSIFKLNQAWDETGVQAMDMRRISAVDDEYFTNYTVYPLQIVEKSSLEEVLSGKSAVDVFYINPAGVVSDEPHDGVNIEVTTFGDGSRASVKRLKH